MFFAEGGIEQLVEHITGKEDISVKEKKTFLETLKEIINKIVDVIKKYVTDNHLSASEKAVADMSLDDVKKLRAQFLEVIDGAIANLENGVEVESNIKYSVFAFDDKNSKNRTKDSKYIIDEIKSNYENISNKILFNVERIDISEYQHKSDFVNSIFEEQGGQAYNKEIGIVELKKKGAKSTIFHGYGTEKIATVRAIKDVIENGSIISRIVNYNNTKKDRYIIAGKGNIDSSKSILGVMIEAYPNQNHNNKFYLHEAIIIEADSHIMTASQNSEITVSESASKDIIRNNEKEVKKSFDVDSDGNKLSKQQQEYFKDSRVRDKNGNLLVIYHGTNNRDEVDTWDKTRKTWETEYKPFTIFETPEWVETTGFFFTDNRDNAGGYGSTLYSVYLNIKNPLIIDCNRQNYSNIKFKGLEYDTYEWAEYAKENGYDGVIFNDVIDGVGYEYFENPINEFVAFKSNQIKNGNLLDVSTNKAPTWFSSRGLQLPKEVQTIISANNIIAKSNKIVKNSLDVYIEGNKLTTEQQEYFADSKVVMIAAGRTGLKIQSWQQGAGSTPAAGTINKGSLII